MASSPDTSFELFIKPRKGWEPVHFAEIWAFRELLWFLVWRDIKIRYKQTLLGGLWAIVQPLAGMLVFGILLRQAGFSVPGGPPYTLFIYPSLVLWQFFSNSVSLAGNSMIGNEHLIRKVYFPRVLIPLAAIAALALDLVVSTAFLALLLPYYHWPVTPQVLLAPVFAAGAFLAAAGTGMFLAALNVQFRDVKYAVPFLLQMGMFVTPVIYPLGSAPPQFRFALSLNPMAGWMEAWRAALLGGTIPLEPVCQAFVISLAIFVAGFLFFHRMERRFADVI